MTHMSEIQDYMDWAGITYEKSGHWIWPTDRDSMRVNLNKDYFNRFSTGVWGHLPEFVAEHDDLTPTEAKKRLADFQQDNPQSRRVDRSTTVDSQPFDLSALHAERQLSTKCRDYLIKTRKIPTKLVDQLVKQGQIMEDTQHHNLVFPWYQGDKIVGADLQGTTYMKDPHQGRHYFKGIARHSAHDFGWTQVVGEGGAPTRAVICEAPIDAMSYGQLFAPQEPTLIVSLGGVEKKGVFANMIAERIGDHGGKLKELVLATDNDDAGRQFIQQFKDAGIQGDNGRVKVNVAIPHEKDWNDDLKDDQTVQQLISLDHFSSSVSETKIQEKQPAKQSTPADTPEPAAEDTPKESYTEKRRQEIAQYSKQVLAAARKVTRTPEDLLEMADFMARFPQYSFHNQVLIKEQKAGALAVAGFTKLKQLGSKVQKGQHGIKIFAPNMVKHVKISDDWVPLNQVTNEQKQAAKKHQLLTKEFIKGYRLVTVFDVTQTTMKAADYPKIYPNRPYEFPSKPENIAELTQAVDEFARGQGITIQERTHLNSKSVAKGYYAPDAKAIVIQSGLPDSEKLKVRLHEMGHALLEHRADKVSRPIAELQAELTSAVVMKHCGINVEREAVPYISAWTDHLQKLDERQFGQQMTIINDVNRASRKIIEGIDPRYQELEKSRAQTIVQKAPTLEKPGMEPLDMGIQRQHSLSR